MSSRRYIARIWQVPKDRGPVEYIATLMCKALRKHGWPAKWAVLGDGSSSFMIHYDGKLYMPPDDFADAVSSCARIIAKTYRIDLAEDLGAVTLLRRYRVTEYGQLREIKDEDKLQPQ